MGGADAEAWVLRQKETMRKAAAAAKLERRKQHDAKLRKARSDFEERLRKKEEAFDTAEAEKDAQLERDIAAIQAPAAAPAAAEGAAAAPAARARPAGAAAARPQPAAGGDEGGEPPSKRRRSARPKQPSAKALLSMPRPRLPTTTTLPEVLTALRDASRIMVLVGAGISVSCGVPDFRSEGGLYSLVESLGLALDDPQELFNIEAFDHDPAPFYSFAHALWPSDKIRPSLTHRFLVALAKQKKLLRVYSQNIDGLERAAGLAPSLLVECHGSLISARCRGCRKTCAAADLAPAVQAKRVPHCDCGGVWKPQVTFFGEDLPNRVAFKLEEDRERADLLLVIGTSLAVAPISKIMGWLPPSTPQVRSTLCANVWTRGLDCRT